MLENLKNNPAIRSLLVLILGLIFLNFFFNLMFGTGTIIYRSVGIINFIIELLVLTMVATFFYGLFRIFKENAKPLLKEFSLQREGNVTCKKCAKNLAGSWNCCPYCGSDK